MTKKAYWVYEKHEDSADGTVIVFAASSREARNQVWRGETPQEVLADSYLDLRARREPWADAYADIERIPTRAYLEHGWTIACAGPHCGRMVALDDLGGVDENGEPLCERCAKAQGLSRPEWARHNQSARRRHR